MTIDVVQDLGSTVQYIAADGQTVFPIPFPFINNTDIVVQAGTITLTNGTDYTVVGAGNDTGGALTLAAGAVANTVYTVSRVLAIQRLTEYQQNGPFTSAAINAELDNIVLVEQQLSDQVNLALRVPGTNPGPITLLTPANYAGKYLAFDSNGNPTPAVLTTSGSLTAAIIAALMNSTIATQLSTTIQIGQTPAEVAASVMPSAIGLTFLEADIRRYGAKCDGVTNDLVAINNAILVANKGAGVARAPAGTIFHSAAITMLPNVRFVGAGKFATTFLSSHTGAGIKTTSTKNTGTGVFTEIRDMRFKNTNASNTNGALVDSAGTEVLWHSVRTEGFAYGGIFDQSELADADLCDFENFLVGGVWLTNGADYTSGASAGFTNRISVTRCQINGGAGLGSTAQGVGIIDDGGAAHTFKDNNYNLCVHHLRIAGCFTVEVSNSEMEVASSQNIVMATTTSVLGTSVGVTGCLTVHGNFISPSAASSFQAMTVGPGALVNLIITGNRLITSAATIINTSNINTVFASGNVDSNTGAIFDGTAANHFEADPGNSTITIKNTNVNLVGAVAVTGAIRSTGIPTFNGATPVAQVTGFGTPTSPSVVANFSGTAATTGQMQATIAQILVVLKNIGAIGA